MNKPVTVGRDSFARFNTVRTVEHQHNETCAWCGGTGKAGRLFRYGTHADGISTRPSMHLKLFCSIQCFRDYNS